MRSSMIAKAELDVDVAWRSGAPADVAFRRRVTEELRAVAWDITQLQALLHDAHQVTGSAHAFLLPKMELRLPMFDLGRRFRVVLQQLDQPAVALFDEDGKKIADVRMV